MKKILIATMIFSITGCKYNEPKNECLFVARDIEDHIILSDSCYIDKKLYCTVENKQIQVIEYEYICEVEYGE